MINIWRRFIHYVGLCDGSMLYTTDAERREFYLECSECLYRTKGVKF